MKLYKIPEATIKEVLKRKDLIEGNQEITEGVEGFKYPLKIIVTVEQETATVITRYPLKKEQQK